MDKRFDGPDLYGVIGSVASELIEVEDEVNLKIGKSDLVTKLKDHHAKVIGDMGKDISVLKNFLQNEFQS